MNVIRCVSHGAPEYKFITIPATYATHPCMADFSDATTCNYEYTWVVDRRKQVQCWCFTLNNYTAAELSEFDILGNSADVKYLILGKEKGEQGTPHLQGFVQFTGKKTFVTVTTKLLPKRCGNVRPMYARSSPYHCFKYCSKDGDYIEYGVQPEPRGVPGRARQASDYQAAIDLARENKLEDVDPGLFLRYYRTLKELRDSAPQQVSELPGCSGLWLVGPPGTGKSTWVREVFGADLFDKPLTKWWCKYRGQQYVLLDDVSTKHAEWIGFFLKRWADKFPFPAEVKGSQFSGADGLIRPRLIIVTSNYTISELFASDIPEKKAIQERFKVLEFTNVRHESRPHILDRADLISLQNKANA